VITNGSVEFGSDLTAAAECQANFWPNAKCSQKCDTAWHQTAKTR
jgi:hypothetical protein